MLSIKPASKAGFIISLSLFSACLCVTLLGATRNAAIPTSTVTRISLSTAALNRYATSRSLDDLNTAVNSLDGTVDVGSLTSDNFIPTRRSLVSAYAAVIHAIQGAYDASFDPNDPKNTQGRCVPPPPSAGVPLIGRGINACVDPDDIKDPTLRAQYVAAVKENAAKTQKWAHYWTVKRLDEHAVGTLQMVLNLFNSVAPTGVGPDFAAIDQILRQAGVTNDRRSKIDAAIYEYKP